MRRSAITEATRERAEQAAWRLRQAELEQKVSELTERLRQSDLAAKAQAKGSELAAGLQERGAELAAKAQPKVEELTSKAQAKGAELAAKAQPKVEELTTRGSELADAGLRRVGERLSTGRSGELLGIEPVQSRSRWPWLVAALVGVAAGYVLGVLTGARRSDSLNQAIEQGRQAAPQLADAIRAQLTRDPRTAGLPDLEVNVSDGTVFVRGTVPKDFDEKTLREVIERVPGVEDVDLHVTATA